MELSSQTQLPDSILSFKAPTSNSQMTMAALIFALQQGASSDDWASSPVSLEGTPLSAKSGLSLQDADETRVRSVSLALTGYQPATRNAALRCSDFISHHRAFGILS